MTLLEGIFLGSAGKSRGHVRAIANVTLPYRYIIRGSIEVLLGAKERIFIHLP